MASLFNWKPATQPPLTGYTPVTPTAAPLPSFLTTASPAATPAPSVATWTPTQAYAPATAATVSVSSQAAQLALLQQQLAAIQVEIGLILASLGPAGATTTPVAPAAAPSVQPLSMMSEWKNLFGSISSFLGSWLTPSPSPSPAPTPAPTPTPTPSNPSPTGPKAPKGTTEFVISSFNVLGSSHTKPGGNKPGMASGVQRIRWAAELINKHKVDIVGLQEYQGDQHKEFLRVAGDKYAVYPGTKLGRPEVVNSIAYRKDKWDMVKPGYIEIPYFHGQKRKMPLILLRNKETGQEAYFANFHNPASTKRVGDQEKWRDKAMALQIEMVKRIERETGKPIFITGDMNEREEYYHGMTKNTDMVSASAPNGKTPKKMNIDWIFGSKSKGVSFSDYAVVRDAHVKKTTDHPMIVAKARITNK
jgi:endonuclease/exonuclease/phosphatase family metal-dependent hydrolase